MRNAELRGLWDCGKRKAKVRTRRGEVIRKWRKRSYKKKEGPGDPVVKRREATALETHLGTWRGRKRKILCG